MPKKTLGLRLSLGHRSLPMMNGKGALSTSLIAKGHSGMYGHCHWNGKSICQRKESSSSTHSSREQSENHSRYSPLRQPRSAPMISVNEPTVSIREVRRETMLTCCQCRDFSKDRQRRLRSAADHSLPVRQSAMVRRIERIFSASTARETEHDRRNVSGTVQSMADDRSIDWYSKWSNPTRQSLDRWWKEIVEMHQRTDNARRERSMSTRTNDRYPHPIDWSDRGLSTANDRWREIVRRKRYKHHIVSYVTEERWRRSAWLMGESLWRASVRWMPPLESRREAFCPRTYENDPYCSRSETCRESEDNIECVQDR